MPTRQGHGTKIQSAHRDKASCMYYNGSSVQHECMWRCELIAGIMKSYPLSRHHPLEDLRIHPEICNCREHYCEVVLPITNIAHKTAAKRRNVVVRKKFLFFCNKTRTIQEREGWEVWCRVKDIEKETQ